MLSGAPTRCARGGAPLAAACQHAPWPAAADLVAHARHAPLPAGGRGAGGAAGDPPDAGACQGGHPQGHHLRTVRPLDLRTPSGFNPYLPGAAPWGCGLPLAPPPPAHDPPAARPPPAAPPAPRAAELQQLPPVLYQVLLVSAAGPRAYALGKISELFEHLARQPGNAGPGGRGPSSVLLQVRGGAAGGAVPDQHPTACCTSPSQPMQPAPYVQIRHAHAHLHAL
jgi:hypothetical protein